MMLRRRYLRWCCDDVACDDVACDDVACDDVACDDVACDDVVCDDCKKINITTLKWITNYNLN